MPVASKRTRRQPKAEADDEVTTGNVTTDAEALVADAFVIDASVAVKSYLPDEEYREQANYLLARLSSGRTILAAPVLIRYEVPIEPKQVMAPRDGDRFTLQVSRCQTIVR